MASLPRPATFPSLLRLSSRRSSSSSPTRKSESSSSLLLNALPLSKKSDLGCETAATPLLNFFGSTPFLIAMAVLYLLGCTVLPSFLAGGMPTATSTLPWHHHHVAHKLFDVTGTVTASSSGQKSVAALLQNRRMALENPAQKYILNRARSAATRHQGNMLSFDTTNTIDNRNTINANVQVDYKEAGLKVSLLQALNASYWNEYPIYENDTVTYPIPTDISVFGSSTSTISLLPLSTTEESSLETNIANSPEVLPNHCPQGPVRLFIAITSRCCTPSARAKRDAIRSSWLNTIQTEYGDSITAQFVLSQPAGGDGAILDAFDFLKEEADTFGDLSFVPGEEMYRQLPAKTLRTLHYALSSPCRYTHIVKTDDDVFLRPKKMLDIIFKAERKYEFDIPSPITPFANGTYSKELGFDGRPVAKLSKDDTENFENLENDSTTTTTTTTPLVPVGETPWMQGMYIGKIDSNRTGVFPGWYPERNSTSKWYLSESDLPDDELPLGARWTSGWGYMMSRDVAQKAWDVAVRNAMAHDVARPVWWGRLPWEDVLIATLLQEFNNTGDAKEKVVISHHPGFKAAWDECDKNTVLKHLDNDAPLLTAGLAAQEASGLWKKKEVVCSTGVFDHGDYDTWRTWRNTLPDNIKGGFM